MTWSGPMRRPRRCSEPVRLGRLPPPGGRDFTRGERRESSLEDPDDIGTPCDSLRVGRQVGINVQPELGAELLPLGIVSARDLDDALPRSGTARTGRLRWWLPRASPR